MTCQVQHTEHFLAPRAHTSREALTTTVLRSVRAVALLSARRGMATADAMSREALSALSHGALVDLVLGAQGGAASAQTTTAGLEEASPPNKKQRKTHEKRSFDMSRHSQRHIALRVAYIGTAYQGFAWQIDAPTGTVEGQLVQALVKTCARMAVACHRLARVPRRALLTCRGLRAGRFALQLPHHRPQLVRHLVRRPHR